MLVYNIRKEKYAYNLTASGIPNRWNRQNEYVIYTGSSRALSILELVVHRASILPDTSYKILTIELNVSDKDIFIIDRRDLPLTWKSIHAYSQLQSIGSKWYKNASQLVLRVPSVIIPQEYNYVLNTMHHDYRRKVKIEDVEDFDWDNRLL